MKEPRMQIFAAKKEMSWIVGIEEIGDMTAFAIIIAHYISFKVRRLVLSLYHLLSL